MAKSSKSDVSFLPPAPVGILTHVPDEDEHGP